MPAISISNEKLNQNNEKTSNKKLSSINATEHNRRVPVNQLKPIPKKSSEDMIDIHPQSSPDRSGAPKEVLQILEECCNRLVTGIRYSVTKKDEKYI